MTHRGKRNGFVKLASNAAYYRRRAAQAGSTPAGVGFAAAADALDCRLQGAERCRECGRALSDEGSRSQGYGPECWQKPSVQARVRGAAGGAA